MSRNPASPGAVSMRNHRNGPNGEEYLDRNRKRSRCRYRAMTALAGLHAAEYAVLYEAELKRAGLRSLQQAGRRPE